MSPLAEPFDLDPAFIETTAFVGDLALCQARLRRDARFAWLILIPRREGARELHDLSRKDRVTLIDEIVQAGGAVRALGEAAGRPVSKLNVAALGNVTAQLHLHVVGRRPDDAAWPAPVWGFGEAVSYEPDVLVRLVATARSALDIAIHSAPPRHQDR